uniref:THAP domain-containing protein 1 n=1 Tax=Hucho hucho TaxID=62062 RepID=A0A4W5L7P6_9TELE
VPLWRWENLPEGQPSLQATGNAFHRYPVKDPERCKRWLIAVRHIKYNVKTPVATLNSLRVCSAHFREDDYERDFQTEIMGTKNKRRLKDTAVPSIFPWTGSAVPKYRGAVEKRKRAEVGLLMGAVVLVASSYCLSLYSHCGSNYCA